ncbi:MAG: hypothetical protein AAF901_02700 [Bacteroidota bacterium]
MVFLLEKFKHFLSLGIFCIAFVSLSAQSDYAKIDKNRNVQAKHLYHDLNKTKDTLVLKSEKKINYLYSINKDYGREFDFYVDTTTYKLPLNKLSLGKHVIVAVQSPLRIVFVVHILREIPAKEPEEKPAKKPSAIRPTEMALRENKR